MIAVSGVRSSCAASGEAPLASHGGGDAGQHVIERIDKRMQVDRHAVPGHRRELVVVAPRQRLAEALERTQTAADPEPEHRQAARHRDQERHEGGQHDVARQQCAFRQPIRGRDVHAVHLHGVGTQPLAVDEQVGKAGAAAGDFAGARARPPELDTHGADLAGKAFDVGGGQHAHRAAPDRIVPGGRILRHQPADHLGRHLQAAVERCLHLAIEVVLHPQRNRGPQHAEREVEATYSSLRRT